MIRIYFNHLNQMPNPVNLINIFKYTLGLKAFKTKTDNVLTLSR